MPAHFPPPLRIRRQPIFFPLFTVLEDLGYLPRVAFNDVGGTSLPAHTANALDPAGRLIGLDGVILLAYVIAIPANEIVVPTILMVYIGAGMMTDIPSLDVLRTLLVEQHGWTLLTAVNLMLFSLLHNPCATTIITIHRETLSAKWTAVGAGLSGDVRHGVDCPTVHLTEQQTSPRTAMSTEGLRALQLP